ncbi:porin family protein [Flavisphingopyxis soli]|nr:hypothetical protein [Sphingorhabdus soli]
MKTLSACTSLLTLAILLASGASAPAMAQVTPPSSSEEPPADDAAKTAESGDAPASETQPGDIVVVGQRIRGAVDTDVKPELQLSEKDVASYGASSIGDLLAAIAPQVGGGRGRGGGQPVILLSGRRISSFRELRNIPSEAILRVDVLPEQVALKFGYAADQRVVNFILKPNFAAVTLEVEAGAPTDGGGGFHQQYEGSVVKLAPNSRINLSSEYKRDNAITQAQRGIATVPTTSDAIDQTPYRTLQSASDDFTLEGTVNRYFGDVTSATLNATLELASRNPLLGLASVPFTQSDDSVFTRSFPEYGALDQSSRTTTGHLGALVDSSLGKWKGSLTGNYDIVHSTTITQRGLDPVAAQAYIAGGGDLNAIFPPVALVSRDPDTADSRNRTFEIVANANGPVFDTAAGPVNLSLATGFQQFNIRSRSVRSGAVATADLTRGQKNAQASLDIPLARDGEGVLGFARSLSVNANIAYRDLSDFGGLTTYGYGLNFAPIDAVQFTASSSTEQGAPSLSQLGSPVIVNPNSFVFDYVTNTTVVIPTITGGNPALTADRRNVLDFGINVRLKKPDGLSLVANYIRERNDNPISSFPTLTAAIQSAFPDRVVRDSAGQLISVDLRPINFQREETDRIRVGLNYSSGGGRGGGPPMMGRGRPGGGPAEKPKLNYRFSLYDTVYLRDRIFIRDGLPVLDLLDGSATGSGGGQARHTVSTDAGAFYDGLGGFLRLSYGSATRVDGGTAIAPAGSTLDFGSKFNLDLRAFFDFDQKEKLVEAHPWLKHTRLRLSVNNLTNSYQRVSDENGIVPLSYQRGFVDPVGRYVEISLRKQF